MEPIVKLTATNVDKVDTLIILPEYSLPNFVGGCSKTVVEIYHLIDDIIRFKDITTCVFGKCLKLWGRDSYYSCWSGYYATNAS